MSPYVAGKDATDSFFGLHRHEVLLKPNYARLQIGVIAGEEEEIKAPTPGQLSQIPYGEPSWLSEGMRYSFSWFRWGHLKLADSRIQVSLL